MEKLLLSAEEKEREEEEIEEEGEEDDDDEEEEELEGDDEEKIGSDEKLKEEQAKARAKKKRKKVPKPAKTKDKEEDSVLNLNNEVVKMRKEVKRVRVLIIRKLIRQISASKKKKGNEAQVEKSQRKAARMLEEIHAMKVLRPDMVTKKALQKKLNFEQVCRDPKATIVDRALARIATHPQFSKKIEDIKAAVEAFKEDRIKDLKQGGGVKVQIQAEKVKPPSPDKSKETKKDKEEGNVKVQLKGMSENKEGDGIPKDSSVAKPKTDTVLAAHSSATADVQKKDIPESESVCPVSTQSSKVKDTVKDVPQSKGAGMKPNAAVLRKQEEEEESDLESSEEKEGDLESSDKKESDLESSDEKEKEYFDDSTEERFLKQSSQSEESEDDFFVGKVSKYKKKKKKQKDVEGEKRVETSDKATTSDRVQSELDELESRLKSKAKFQSVFFSSLSGPMKSAGEGAGRGRGGDKFRGSNRDFSKQSKFQKEFTGPERNSGTKYSRPEDRRSESGERGFASGGRGRGRGRGDFTRQKVQMGRGAFSQPAPQQALHPSWEASKKRKEQQGQIPAFQGKKIRFDDDD
ncbi:serum response factor-binding protein 1 isoform X3 [Hippoglossus hippoglossus]|uniref:serum response factor-binding protein 1 isoform X3 n=1 Tax=Hippoglossus hippoglossus TaxID=8267 RepID=UPI00148D2A9E|nr:serum response factor-binding protein 1 isoform X3 [Hippoglossus hippoglossus]